MTRRWQFLLLVAALATFTAVLRTDGILIRSIWLDEAFSWGISTRSTWSDVLTLTARDTHPPFYYFVLKLWIHLFGDSVLAMRSLSIVCAALSTVAAALFCRDVLQSDDKSSENNNWPIVSLACCLFALNPTHCQWSQEVRMYSLATMLALWSSWFLLNALTQSSRSLLWWGLYSLTALSLLYTHHYGMFTVLAQGLTAAWACFQSTRSRRENKSTEFNPRFLHVAASFAFILLGYLPWIPVLRSQVSRVQESFWIPSVTVWSVPDAWFSALFSANSPPVLSNHFLPLLVANLTIVIWILFLIARASTGRVLTFALGTVPLVFATAVSLTTVSILTSRHLILSLPFFYIAFSCVVWKQTLPNLRPVVFAMILINAVAVFWVSRESLELDSKAGLNMAVETLRKDFQPGDEIVVVHPAMYYSFWHCTQKDFDQPQLLDLGEIDHFMGSSILSDNIKISQNELLERNHQRLWTIDSTGYSRPYSGPQEKLFQTHWIKISESRFAEPYYFQGSVVLIQYRRIQTTEPASQKAEQNE